MSVAKHMKHAICVIILAVVLCSAVFTFGYANASGRSQGLSVPSDQRPQADGTDALTSHPWRWKSYGQTAGAVDIDRPAAYEISFAKDGTVSIQADCNRASGSFKIDGQNLSINVGPTTLVACPGNSRGEQFLQLLGTAEKFVIAGDLLIVILKGESTLAFRAPNLIDKCGEKILQPVSISDSLDRELTAALDERLVSFVNSATLPAPGVSMLVTTPKGRYFKAVGVSDAAACTRLNANSPFQIGSNTKLMTSAIIYQLQESGKLSTSDKLSKYLPDAAAKFPYGNEITLEMLLTHTSGLMDYFDVNNGDGGMAAGMTDKTILKRGYRPGDLIDLAANSGKSDFKPGEAGKWKYCNTGFILLGMIIEKVTNKSYEANLKGRIFGPIKLKHTYLQTGQPAVGSVPVAYYQAPFTYTTNEWDASQAWSAGAVVSTSEEFAAFLKALFTGKLFRSKATLSLMESSLPAEVDALGKGMTYGHGMLKNNGVLGHGGQTLGFQSDGGYIRDKDVIIVVWSNGAANNVNRLAIPGLAALFCEK